MQKNLIALDANIFIYHFEGNKKFLAKTTPVFESIEMEKYQGVSSIITLAEILTLPKREKDYLLVKEYSETLLNFPNLKFIDVDYKIVDLASSLRAKYRLTTPDAIQIATALASYARYFLTVDRVFKKVKEIKIKLF